MSSPYKEPMSPGLKYRTRSAVNYFFDRIKEDVDNRALTPLEAVVLCLDASEADGERALEVIRQAESLTRTQLNLFIEKKRMEVLERFVGKPFLLPNAE